MHPFPGAGPFLKQAIKQGSRCTSTMTSWARQLKLDLGLLLAISQLTLLSTTVTCLRSSKSLTALLRSHRSRFPTRATRSSMRRRRWCRPRAHLVECVPFPTCLFVCLFNHCAMSTCDRVRCSASFFSHQRGVFFCFFDAFDW
jgi:hypothetical protein